MCLVVTGIGGLQRILEEHAEHPAGIRTNESIRRIFVEASCRAISELCEFRRIVTGAVGAQPRPPTLSQVADNPLPCPWRIGTLPYKGKLLIVAVSTEEVESVSRCDR